MSDVKLVALVDDHTMFRKGLAVLIDLFPQYKVMMDVANGKEFIDQLDPDNKPDIVLLDIHMPVMDGFATAAWLRNNHPEVHVLALSTMDSDSTIIKMIHQGARGPGAERWDESERSSRYENRTQAATLPRTPSRYAGDRTQDRDARVRAGTGRGSVQ